MKKVITAVSLIMLFGALCLPTMFAGAQIINPGGPNQPCYAFSANLARGMSGQDVFNLQRILIAQNLLQISAPTSYFGSLTFAATVAFQDKYASAILSPLGLSNGTGFVGFSTRSELNALYGCGAPGTPTAIKPVINSLQPASGIVGSSVTITGSGFTPTGNEIVFGSLGSENNPGYSLNSSNNGTAITFTVPTGNYLACWYSTPSCMVAKYLTQPGNYEVSIINANGTSNQLPFTVTSSVSATCTPNWTCGWGVCSNGEQSMTAIDSNTCGLPQSGQIACPALARLCN